VTRDRKLAAVAVGLAVLVAAITALRSPSRWSATLQAVSVFDGFHKRVLVGTLLRPFAYLAHDSYYLYAGFSFVVLATVIGVLVAAAIRTDNLVLRLWVVAWFLLPTGAFLFNEIGYFEQVLYLMLFASIYLVGRGRVVAATTVMAFAPFVHEIAILTVIPIYGVVLLRAVPLRRAVIATLIPAAVNAILLVIPGASSGAVPALEARLATADFTYRIDALALFQRTQAESWKLYNIHDVVVYVKWPMIVLVIAAILLWASDRRGWGLPVLVALASVAAIATPYLLVYGGWDGNRWLFLVMTNFFAIVWLALRGRDTPLPREAITILVITVLVMSRMNMWYFDRLHPRELSYRGVVQFVRGVANGGVFKLANE
jgi:hypothetical protein